MAGNSSENDRGEQRIDTDATGEFFSVGVPLHAVRAGYIRRRADDQLYDAIMSGRYAHVLAPDRSGKSSLIAATAARLESSAHKIAILDLEQLGDKDGSADSARWYYSVAYRLLRQLRIRYDLQSWWQDKTILSNRQRLFEFYSEVLLQQIAGPIVIFVDEIQCTRDLSYADELLTSIRAAHNARTTDPDFSRLCFVLLGECDPINLMQEAELSPFNVTQQIFLDDFSREELQLFATELNLHRDAAAVALDRIYYWTNGQPYLSQKLARAVARESDNEAVEELIDRVASTQIAGRAALHSEPHMSHIHRGLVNDTKRIEPLLNLYGKIRKGITVPADLGSALQRRLMAIGLLVIDDDSNVSVRNRLYEMVFTARWANENLPTRLKVPAIVAGVLLLFSMIPFWYTQWLPNPYLKTLASDVVELPTAIAAYENFRSFPGHADTADDLYRSFLQRRALAASDTVEIQQLVALVTELPNAGSLAGEFEAGFWDRKARAAAQLEDRDAALLASIQSFAVATSARRQRAAALVGDDYPYLLTTLPEISSGSLVFDPLAKILTAASGAQISQHSYTPQGIQIRESWAVTALEVSPLVRRVIVDRQGAVSRIGLTLNISHARLADLRIKIIAPSGRTVEIETGMERASDNDDIRIPVRQLRDLLGESLSGTWSISVRDESLGVAGQLVGWNLKLNSQGAVEYFQRGLNIPDPVERETEDIWFDASGRYAVARAMQSDSARIWDLAFAEPLRAIALHESEKLIGLDAAARRLVTASQDSVNLWDTATGDRVATLQVGPASSSAVLTSDRSHLFVEQRGDVESRLQLWNLESESMTAELVVAGVPALVAIDAAGSRVAIADFDRAVRVWNFQTAELIRQFDLPAQPGSIKLSADGSTLGAVYPDVGLSLWSVARPQRPIVAELGEGSWQFSFSPSGNIVAAGRPETGFQTFHSANGRLIGPPLGVRRSGQKEDFLAFSQDEQILLMGSTDSAPRIWRVPVASSSDDVQQSSLHTIWSASADRVLVAAPDGTFMAIGDPHGHVHIVSSDATLSEVATISEDVSYVGHSSAVRLLSVNAVGSLVASVAADNSMRLWKTNSGEPLPYIVEIGGAPVAEIRFSPGAAFVGILSGNRVSVLAVDDGSIVTQHELGTGYSGLTFASDYQLYLGAQDGSLRLLSRNADKNWHMQQVWQGPEGIRVLQASPRGDVLVLVDENNFASQFFLADGRIGNATLQLPSSVQEIEFDNNGTYFYFRTPRWIHQVSSSTVGLTWTNAVFVPRPLNGGGIVHGNGVASASAGRKIYLPVPSGGFLELVDVSLNAAGRTGLFGNQKDLLREWRNRISVTLPEES